MYVTCIPGQQGPAPSARLNFCSYPRQGHGVDSDLHVPQEGHRGPLPPSTPQTVISLRQLCPPILVLGQNPCILLQKASGSWVINEFPGPDSPLGPPLPASCLSEEPGSGLGTTFIHPSQLTPVFTLFLFVFSVCVFPNLFTSVSPFFLFFFLIKEQSFLLLCNLKKLKKKY